MQGWNNRRWAAVGAAVVLVLFSLGFFAPAPTGVQAPSVNHRTAEERLRSLEDLRMAWFHRPEEITSEHAQAERVFLNRLAYFVRATQGTPEHIAAQRLWNQCYREHAARHGDFIDPK